MNAPRLDFAAFDRVDNCNSDKFGPNRYPQICAGWSGDWGSECAVRRFVELPNGARIRWETERPGFRLAASVAWMAPACRGRVGGGNRRGPTIAGVLTCSTVCARFSRRAQSCPFAPHRSRRGTILRSY